MLSNCPEYPGNTIIVKCISAALLEATRDSDSLCDEPTDSFAPRRPIPTPHNAAN